LIVPMNYRPLGNTGLKVSELGFGCASLGGGLFSTNAGDPLGLIHRCLDAGVNFFDTSDTYGLGDSERLLGRALRGRRDEAIIATKVGGKYGTMERALLRSRPLLRPLRAVLGKARRSIKLAHARRKQYDYSPAHMVKAVDASLKRLGTDYIDLYQLYNPTLQDLQGFEAGETLERLKAAGKIRHYGVTIYDLSEGFAALEHPGIASIQVGISLVDQSACAELLAAARSRGVAVIAASSLAEGLLTGAVGMVKADESSHHTAEQLVARRARAGVCAQWVRPNRTLAQTALRFSLALEGVSTAIFSAINLGELNEDLGALDSPVLNAAEFESMRRMEAGTTGQGRVQKRDGEAPLAEKSAKAGSAIAAEH
jgi:aryl-alcohol dehydrogenase-like predicted oxidoreductase